MDDVGDDRVRRGLIFAFRSCKVVLDVLDQRISSLDVPTHVKTASNAREKTALTVRATSGIAKSGANV